MSGEEAHVINCSFESIGDVAKALEAALGPATSVKIVWKPSTTTMLDEEKAASMLKLIDTLEEDDDVQNVFSNFEVSDEVMARLTAA